MPLQNNLGNKENERCDVFTSLVFYFGWQYCGGFPSVARLQPISAQFFDFGLLVNRHLLPRKEAAEDEISAARY
ncbi:hypothetical protein [Paenisporosarcina antarctica]|uniref:hypothetical protein n=1 Tax=Paenisporosarcina antarctica TaxID=417367 RepID=UPI001416FC81|nr:hypothetical protein [Paenisporosarcina antarctica]